MTRDAPEAAARALVAERYPQATQAWLAGSIVTGRATRTSDLDITVLLGTAQREVEGAVKSPGKSPGEVHRESLEFAGWPVELFVHTSESIEYFVAKDLARRHPTMARLVATGIPLLGEGGEDVRRHCQDVLASGPGAVAADDLSLMRYGLTDLLDDLADDRPSGEVTAVALGVWRATAELALAISEAWSGTGKWLVRELVDLDARQGTHLASALDAGLRRALEGDLEPLRDVADRVLDQCGGRYWTGLYRAADLP